MRPCVYGRNIRRGEIRQSSDITLIFYLNCSYVDCSQGSTINPMYGRTKAVICLIDNDFKLPTQNSVKGRCDGKAIAVKNISDGHFVLRFSSDHRNVSEMFVSFSYRKKTRLSL